MISVLNEFNIGDIVTFGELKSDLKTCKSCGSVLYDKTEPPVLAHSEVEGMKININALGVHEILYLVKGWSGHFPENRLTLVRRRDD